MSLRPEVLTLAAFAPLAPEDDWEVDDIDAFAAAIEAVHPPITAEEREALLPVFSCSHEDSVYGVAWGVLHLLESSPSDGWQERLDTAGHPWLELLTIRHQNYLDSRSS